MKRRCDQWEAERRFSKKVKTERSKESDNVEAVKSSTDNPEQARPGLSLTLQKAEHGGGK